MLPATRGLLNDCHDYYFAFSCLNERLPEGSASALGTEQREATCVERRRNAFLSHTAPTTRKLSFHPPEPETVFVDGALDLEAGAASPTVSSASPLPSRSFALIGSVNRNALATASSCSIGPAHS